MFDPNKYDRNGSETHVQELSGESFIAKRDKVLKYLKDARSLMIKECEFMENRIKSNPEGKFVGPFEEKLEGLSKVINGIDILDRMYTNN